VGLVQQKFAKEPQATFPVLLLKMLDHYTSNSSDLMGWCEDGKSFFLARGDARIAEAIKPWFARKLVFFKLLELISLQMETMPHFVVS